MRDLQIRGAGSGHSQHGHMEAVGYGSVCKDAGPGHCPGRRGLNPTAESEMSGGSAGGMPTSRKIYLEVRPHRSYKRIAAIQSPEDCCRLETSHRPLRRPAPLGQRPGHVLLARVQATAVGVYEVAQRKDVLTLQLLQLQGQHILALGHRDTHSGGLHTGQRDIDQVADRGGRGRRSGRSARPARRRRPPGSGWRQCACRLRCGRTHPRYIFPGCRHHRRSTRHSLLSRRMGSPLARAMAWPSIFTYRS